MKVQKRGDYLSTILLAALIAAPWVLPGYLFGTDWPGPRRFSVSSDLSSGTVLDVALVAVSAVVSAEIAAKLLVLGALIAAALGAFRALPVGGFIPRALASVIYVVNPFVYGRFHYGQLPLIAAYALLPWIAITLLGVVREPTWRPSVILAVELTALGILDLHLLIPAGLLLIAAAVVFALSHRNDRRYLVRLGRNVTLALGITFIASSYWLIPFLAGTNSEGRLLTGVGGADLDVYSASPDPSIGLIPNLLGLYGFWAEDTGRFDSMKAFVPLWPLVLLVLLGLGTIGARSVLRSRPEIDFPGARPWIFALLGAGAVALILEMGVASPVTAPLVRFLDAVFPPYRGMRDAGKWAALIALVYAQLIPLGGVVVLGWLREHPLPGPPRKGDGGWSEVAQSLASGLLLALPLYYGNGLLFGAHGEIQPSVYPTGWYQADRLLTADPHPGRTLFLPWHLYLGLDFVRNTNNVVASPAPSFFNVPVVISQDPEIPGIAPPTDPEQAAISHLVKEGSSEDWASVLASRNIKYVLLAREVDWSGYQFLNNQPGFARVADYGSIVVYRNLLAK